uniref:SUN domain-containing ossification factor n=1 Tax=Cyclopterus lumpus TaxID=8103 RepID=A0A8C2XR36_CYCLU
SLKRPGGASWWSCKSHVSLWLTDAGLGSTASEPDPSVPGKEDIPTFDEWKKQVMEVEKSQSLHTSTGGSPHPVKKVQMNFKNNYASVECGAKILSANNGATSTSAILMENMDIYMLNPCSNKIWFVIELCEPIQVKQLDIGNFELFSSTPKDFLVSISDRYPTNKWVKLGTFHARDERIVQSYPLDEQLYAIYVKMFIKYIKVELLSHFGSEHFCPLSLIRVFGTSMVEEYEEIADSQYPSERLEYLDEDYGMMMVTCSVLKDIVWDCFTRLLLKVSVFFKTLLNSFLCLSSRLEAAEPELPATHEEEVAVSGDSATPPPSSPDSLEDRKIVTLVEEEDEEPRQSTVTLMEEEAEEEEEEEEEKKRREESTRREADRNQWESQIYCPFSSFSLSFSCMATLPELLHRWCSARLAKERLRRRQGSTRTQTHPDDAAAAAAPSLAFTTMAPPPPIPDPVPAPLKEALPVAEKALEPEAPVQGEGKTSGEAHAARPNLNIVLEPSRTATLPPHSFSDTHSSLASPTPTHEEKPLPPVKDAAVDPAPTPTSAVAVPETQQAGGASPAPPGGSHTLAVASETASPGVVVPPVKEQPPVQSLPTASRPEDLIPPPTELPAALPPTDAHADAARSGADGGDSQRHGVQASQEQGDSLAPAGEPHRVEDAADEDLLGTNGNVHRIATDFYAELQNGGDYSGGAMAGNGASLNGGAVHGSSQRESVFMRLNNRIKALEMNMSLSGRYLEELSQRYRKQMEEMQRAFNQTIIKLQNTSRIAEEQDQKQTEAIQVLQSQVENVKRLMLNLTDTVGQLQREVSDRQSYLVVSLVLCLSLGLLLCLQCCRGSSCPAPKTIAAPLPKSNHYPSPKRCFSSYDDMSLKRRVTCPLVRSKSFHLSSTEGPDDLYIVEPLRFSPEKKVQCLFPPLLLAVSAASLFFFFFFFKSEEEEVVASPPTCTSKEFPSSETSSCSSSTHSEESYASRLPPPSPGLPSSGLCNGHRLPFSLQQPPARSRQVKRRKSRQTELRFPAMPGGGVASLPSLQQLMKGNKEIGVGTIGATAVTGHV